MKKLIIASTSTIYGGDFLEYLLPTLETFFQGVNTVLFIPYARASGRSYNEYTAIANKAFTKMDKKIIGIHEFDNAKVAVEEAEAIYVGGGNTFELVNQLYKNDLIPTLKKVIEKGTPYLGTSAGSNICGVTMMNTNDMPIVYPPSFDTLDLIPFNINPHYLDPDTDSKHMGETRETRINEYHIFNDLPVLGLREGSWLEVNDNKVILKGKGNTARLFQKQEHPSEIDEGKDILKYI